MMVRLTPPRHTPGCRKQSLCGVCGGGGAAVSFDSSGFLLQEKIHKLYERKLHGDFDTNSHIQKKKEFRNPRYAAPPDSPWSVTPAAFLPLQPHLLFAPSRQTGGRKRFGNGVPKLKDLNMVRP